MHCGEHWIRDLVGSKDRVPTSGVMADYDPFGSPVTGAIAHQRLSVTCDGKPYLASCQLVRPKELDTTNSVLDPVKVESDSPLGIPIWSFLHFHMIAAADIHRDASHFGRNTALSEIESPQRHVPRCGSAASHSDAKEHPPVGRAGFSGASIGLPGAMW